MKKIAQTVLLYIVAVCLLPYNYAAFVSADIASVIEIIINIVRAIPVICVLFYTRNNSIPAGHSKTFKRTTSYYIAILILNIASTLTSGSFSVLELISRSLSILCIYSVIIFIIYNSSQRYYILSAISNVSLLFTILSLITFVIFPEIGQSYEGNGQYALIGAAHNRNSIYELVIPAVFLRSFLKMERSEKKNAKDILVALICMVTIILSKSATGAMSLFIYIAIAFFGSKAKDKKTFYKIINIVQIGIWAMLSFAMLSNQNLGFIANKFNNKSDTFSGRTIIWQKAIHYISLKPILGYGYDNTTIGDTATNLDYSTLEFPNDPHNSILFLLITSGLIGLLVNLSYLLEAIKNAQRLAIAKPNYAYIVAFFTSFIIRGLTESCWHYSHLVFSIVMAITYLDVAETSTTEIKGIEK